MDEKSFRVLLDFTEVNLGETALKYVWMFISPRELKTIFDFKKAITKKFTLSQENFKLYLRDGLLLDDEKIGILREDDSIKLQFDCLNQYSNASYVQISHKATIHEQCHSSHSSLVEMRKTDETETSTAKKRRKKKRKHDTIDLEIQSEEAVLDITTESESIKNTKERRKEKHIKDNSFCDNNLFSINNEKSLNYNSFESETHANDMHISNESIVNECSIPFTNTSLNISSAVPENTQCDPNDGSNVSKPDGVSNNDQTQKELEDKPKRKRKRKRKRKETNIDFSENIPCEIDLSFTNKSNSATATHEAPLKNRKHVIYHSPSPSPKHIDTISLDSLPDESYVQNDTPLVLIPKNFKSSAFDSNITSFIQKESDINLESASQENTLLKNIELSPKISTPVSIRALKEQSWSVTPMPKFSNSNGDALSGNNCNGDSKNVNKLPYADCPLLTYLPPIGTHLAFKTLELNENYCPELTDFKEGILKKVYPDTDELEIELVQEEIKPAKMGKFENIGINDAIPEPQVIKTVSINWTNLLDPRLVS